MTESLTPLFLGESEETENNESKQRLPEYLKMYEIPGQDPITEHSFDRYREDKKQEDEIRNRATDPALRFKDIISRATSEERERLRPNITEYVRRGLESNDLQIISDCAEMIKLVSKDDQVIFGEKLVPIVEQGLASSDEKIQVECAKLIDYVPEDRKIPFLRKGFGHSNREVQEYCAYLIDFLKNTSAVRDKLRESVDSLIDAGLNDSDVEAQKFYARLIPFATKSRISEFIKRGLETENKDIQLICCQEIIFLEDQEKPSFLEKVKDIIEKGLEIDDLKTQYEYAENIGLADEKDQPALRKKVDDIIRNHLDSFSGDIEKTYAILVEHASKRMKSSFLKRGLLSPNQGIRKLCASLIWTVDDPLAQRDLFETAKEKIGQSIVNPPLYDKADIRYGMFSRAKFEKTGSETTLIGGELKGKTIVRHIKPESFLIWQELYEDYEFWKGQGFDYVPIEPIQSFRLNKDGFVDVYTGVLDLSLGAWERMGGDFSFELKRESVRILRALEEKGIEHGHAHSLNYCLRFFRDDEGYVDLTKKPRIYLIDFDQSFSLV